MVNPVTGGFAYRIHKGDHLGLQVLSVTNNFRVSGSARVVYDTGERARISFPTTAVPVGSTGVLSDVRAKSDGWVINVFARVAAASGVVSPNGGVYIQAFIVWGDDLAPANVHEIIAQGYVGGFQSLVLGVSSPLDFNPLWVFQGTIASDATVGTHVCTLTVSPGVGQSFEVLYGQVILAGAAALASSVQIQDNAGNAIVNLQTGTTAVTANWPFAPGTGVQAAAGARYIVSGAMNLVLTATTSTVSQTQTFACALRLKGSLPTATLADTVGTPVSTTNTSQVF